MAQKGSCGNAKLLDPLRNCQLWNKTWHFKVIKLSIRNLCPFSAHAFLLVFQIATAINPMKLNLRTPQNRVVLVPEAVGFI